MRERERERDTFLYNTYMCVEYVHVCTATQISYTPQENKVGGGFSALWRAFDFSLIDSLWKDGDLVFVGFCRLEIKAHVDSSTAGAWLESSGNGNCVTEGLRKIKFCAFQNWDEQPLRWRKIRATECCSGFSKSMPRHCVSTSNDHYDVPWTPNSKCTSTSQRVAFNVLSTYFMKVIASPHPTPPTA